MSRAHQLSSGLQRLKLNLAPAQQNSLLNYADVLLHWNRSYNLIAKSTESSLVQRHLLDSLSVVSEIDSSEHPALKWIDIGSGAGLPGIPLAIALPEIDITLLDSNSKKTRFLLQAVAELELPNVTVLHSRADEHEITDGYDIIVSRAWTAIPKGLRSTAHLGRSGARWWFMKGKPKEEELLGVPKQFTLARSVALPSDGEARHLFEFTA